GLDMKMGDVEYRGDGKKATFYYTANGRVDFRELVKAYAKEFKVKIEMRQIGSRQESARIGGIGACGRELCCSTWLSDFKSVNTNAARYQNISINQTKLSGQCGRLKCCLNYELDTYLDALDSFPKDPEVLKTQKGNANLVKMDIFKGLLYYSYENPKFKGQLITLSKEQVAEILKQNKKNHIPEELVDISFIEEAEPKEAGEGEIDLIDTFEEIVLPNQRKKRRNSRSNKNRPNSNNPENRQKQDRPQRKSGQNQNNKSKQTNKSQESNKPQDKTQSPENKTGGTQNRESSNNQNKPSKKPRNKNQRNNRNNQQNRQKPNNDENK
nr:regulatory iron-sulfur-containing complex subunit RicT [Saprospiraceae bacterium]